MIFGKKHKDEGLLPDLPAPEFPDMPRHSSSKVNNDHALPAFPDSPSHNRFSQHAIKDAVSRDHEMTMPGMGENSPPAGKNIKVVEMDEWQPEEELPKILDEDEDEGGDDEDDFLPPTPPKQEVHHRKAQRIERPPRVHETPVKKSGDVFVRLDKFRTARKSLGEIEEKLHEINDMIKKIRETKLREDQELGNWEKEMMQVKSRIQEITEDIFEKVD